MKTNKTRAFISSTTQLKKAIISISALLNSFGQGDLYFGVEKDGKVVGIEATKKTLNYISKSISKNITPKFDYQISFLSINSRKCIHISLFGKHSPYYAYGKVYKRKENRNIQLFPNEINQMIIPNGSYKKFWDSLPSDFPMQNIDEQHLNKFIEKAKKSGRLKSGDYLTVGGLKKLGVVQNNRINNAGKLLFSSDNPLRVDMKIYSDDEQDNLVEHKIIHGNLHYVMKRVIIFIKSNMEWKDKNYKDHKEKVPEIPIKALCEALVNSFCHRDYKNDESNKIIITGDQIEIYNPGKFPDILNPSTNREKNHTSFPRNPILANLLYLSGDIKKWGSGLDTIQRESEHADLDVEFKNGGQGFSTIFYRN